MKAIQNIRNAARLKAMEALGRPSSPVFFSYQATQVSNANILTAIAFDPGYEIQNNDGTFIDANMPGYDDPTV